MKKITYIIILTLLPVVLAAASGPWPQSEVALTGTASNPTVTHYFHCGYDKFTVGGTTVDTNYYTITWPADPAYNLGFTVSNAGLWSYQVNSANAAIEGLSIIDTYQPTSGQTGSTVEYAAYFQQTSDSGVSYQNEQGGAIKFFKFGDHCNAAGQADNDVYVDIFTNKDGTLTSILKMVPGTNTGITFPASSRITTGSSSGSLQTGFLLLSANNDDFWTMATTNVAYGNSGFILEGGTTDNSELILNYPTYADGTDGDITAQLVAKRSVSVTVADTGADVDPATATLTPRPTANLYVYTQNDDDGCTLTVSETGSEAGQVVTITNTTAYALNAADQANILDIAGGAWAGGANDTLTLIYTGTIWVEMARADN